MKVEEIHLKLGNYATIDYFLTLKTNNIYVAISYNKDIPSHLLYNIICNRQLQLSRLGTEMKPRMYVFSLSTV